VWLQGEASGVARFLYTSDWHLLARTVGGPEADQTERARLLVQRINDLAPDVAICTGDAISRYGVGKQLLSAERIRWQGRQLAAIASGLRVPFYLVPGNHDLALGASRQVWRDLVHPGWERATMDCAFDWEACRFVLLDGFAYYDEENVLVARAYTSEQMAWLRRTMEQAPQGYRRLLFAHYDYDGSLIHELADLGVDALFYGHSNRGHEVELDAAGILNGHLLDTEAFRWVEVHPDRIESYTVSWDELVDRCDLSCEPCRTPNHSEGEPP
jgi:predicted MPP superfamily phosphohydrolase